MANQTDSMKRSPVLFDIPIPSSNDVIRIQAENAEQKESAKKSPNIARRRKYYNKLSNFIHS